MAEIDWTRGTELVLRYLDTAVSVHRQVETIEFIQSDLSRRSVSVDFDQTRDLSGDASSETGGADVELVTLTMLRKATLWGLDVRDEGGRALPVLTSSENGALAWSMLVVATEALLEAQASSALVDQLQRIAFGHAEEADALVDAMKETPTPEGSVLFSQPGWESLVRDIARNFLFIVPIDWVSERRRIVKYSYLEPVEWEASPRFDWREWLGWDPMDFEFSIDRPGDSDSYHVELRVPDGLIATTAVLAVESEGETFSDEQTGPATVVHLRAHGIPRRATGTFTVSVRADAHGFLRSAFITALGITALLATLTVLSAHIAASNGSTVAGVLLVAPGVVATYLARPGEHSLVAKFLLGPRLVLTVSGASSFVGAIGIALFTHGGRVIALGATALVAAAATCSLWKALEA